jgi:hypothetical protein
MPYLVAAVETGVPWTTTEAEVQFEGRTLTLRPGSKTLYPTVVVEYRPDTREAQADALGLVRRFLSALAWTGRSYIRIAMVSGGGFAVRIGRSDIGDITVAGVWRADYLPEPDNEGSRRALAFYREANGLETTSVPYAFLGFTKILNIKLSKGNDQIAWMNATLPKLKDHRALERLAELRQSTTDVGEYLYGSGRCAVAHAYGESVNPDDVSDTLRMAQDLPVAKALAEYFIEHELGVKSRSTIYAEHLYELDGFRKLFGAEIVAKLKAGEAPTLDMLRVFPNLTIRLDPSAVVAERIAFANLRVAQIAISDGVAVLYCISPDERLHLAVGLDFANERLVFQPAGGTQIVDDGSVSTIDHAIVRLRFFREMLLNGRTEICDADSGERLGRTDAFVATNIDLGASIENIDAALEELEAERTRRVAGLQTQTGCAAGK